MVFQASGFERQALGLRLWAAGSTLEVFPALASKLDSGPIGRLENNLPGSRDLADWGDVNACDSRRDSLGFGSGEEQLVVVASVQCGLKIDFAGGLVDLGKRNGIRRNLGANSALVTDVPEVGREAVAEIDHRCGETLFTQELTNFNSRDRIEVAEEVGPPKFSPGEQELQRSRGASQCPGHIDAVCGTRARAKDCFPFRHRTNDNNVCQNSAWGLGRVSPGEAHVEPIRQLEQAFQKLVNPTLG